MRTLHEFKARTQLVVEKRDRNTGEVPRELIKGLRADFRSLPNDEAKFDAIEWLNEQIKDFINALEVPSARSYLLIRDGIGQQRFIEKRSPNDPNKMPVEEAIGRAVHEMEVGEKLTIAEFRKILLEFRPDTGSGALQARLLAMTGAAPSQMELTDEFKIEPDLQGRRCIVRLR